MKNRKIFEETLKSYREIANKYLGGEIRYYKVHLIYEIIDEMNNQNIGLTDEEEEKLCDFIFDAYINYDGEDNITIYNIVYTVACFINEENMTVEDILGMLMYDFYNKIIL